MRLFKNNISQIIIKEDLSALTKFKVIVTGHKIIKIKWYKRLFNWFKYLFKKQ